MELAYICSQILTAIEYGLLGATYLSKRRRLIIVLDIFSMLAGIIAYILLGADLGMGMSIVIFLANFYYLYTDVKRKKKNQTTLSDRIFLSVVLLAIAVITFLTFDGPLSLLSVAATVMYEISIWQKSTKVYKFLGIFVALCWMLYNGVVFSVVGVFFEAIMLTTSIIGYIRELQSQKSKKVKKNKKS